MNTLMRFSFFLLLLIGTDAAAQEKFYTTAKVHSHNDYEQPFPFWSAYKQGFGSIEVDIFLEKGALLVAHDRSQLKKNWTLDSLYLLPLQQCIKNNAGYIYADTTKQLQLLVDIKTDATTTIKALVEKLNNYTALLNAASLKIVITGNKPVPSNFNEWPAWMQFDGDINYNYTNEELKRIALFSDNFAKYSSWNGKGRLPEKEMKSLQQLINKAQGQHKRIRFWNSPDIINSWYAYINLKIDFINTDHIEAISTFLQQFPDRQFSASTTYGTYIPKWKNDGLDKPVKNIILFIGDGTGLAQWYAGYTVNNEKLNVFNMHFTGLSKTSSYDNYITDSAPGATAFSSGVKTNNRAVGVDHTGTKLTLLPEMIRERKMKTGIITSGDFRDATPAAFYAHQSERSNYADILLDLNKAPVDVIIGACDISGESATKKELEKKFTILYSVDSINLNSTAKLIVADPKASLGVSTGRDDWAEKAFDKTIRLLSKYKTGFLLVVEGAQIDHGGHANKLPYAISELLDFDKVIGKAMEFADSNGETLIIVTGDHETGGLTLTGGDYKTKTINGQFSTGDHTAIPVPVFAYGPQAQVFSGVYENTAIFYKILKALKITPSK